MWTVERDSDINKPFFDNLRNFFFSRKVGHYSFFSRIFLVLETACYDLDLHRTRKIVGVRSVRASEEISSFSFEVFPYLVHTVGKKKSVDYSWVFQRNERKFNRKSGEIKRRLIIIRGVFWDYFGRFIVIFILPPTFAMTVLRIN